MKRKHGTKWDRNRYHQIDDASYRTNRVRGIRRKSDSNRSTRHSIKTQCHKALTAVPDVGIDIDITSFHHSWDCRCCTTAWVALGHDNAWYLRHSKVGPRFLTLSKEELQRLPSWVRYKFERNKIRSSNPFAWVRYAYQTEPLPSDYLPSIRNCFPN